MKLLEVIDTITRSYNGINKAIQEIDEVNRKALLSYFDKHSKRIAMSPGSKASHQAWTGGYMDHISHMIQLADSIYYDNKEPEFWNPSNFTIGDIYLVIFLHDFEKPFRLVEPKFSQEDIKKEFESFGFQLNDMHLNALKYAHGENEDYIPHQRVMNELAGILHAVDVLSARTYHQREQYWSCDSVKWYDKVTE